jgi:hypothetical protein
VLGVQHCAFFYRVQVDVDGPGVEFEPVGHPSLNAYLYRPVLAGMWTHREAVDGTFTFADLMDVHELLDVKAANEIRFQAWQKAQQ